MSDFKSFIESKLLSFDPNIDLNTGSPAQTQIVTPLLQRLETDPFATDTRTFLKAKLKELFPSMSVVEGDAVVDILVSAAQLYFEVYRREVQRVQDSQSINNVSLISDESADALAANWLVDRNPGAFAVGIARILFNNPTTVRIDSSASCSTISGDKFIPAQVTTVSAASMLLNVLPGPQYYVDIVVRSVNPGSRFNIELGKLVVVSGIPGASGVTNLTKFTGGSDREDTKTLLLDKLPQSITERSLTTARGVNARIRDLFTSIEASQVVGFKDPEMNRDVVTATAEGDTAGFGCIVITGRAALIINMTKLRDVVAGDQVTVEYPGSLYPVASIQRETFTIEEVIARDQLAVMQHAESRVLVSLDRSPALEKITALLPNNDEYPIGFIAGYARSHAPPQVIVNVDQVEEVLESGGVHIGGHTDVYVKPKVDSERSATLLPFPAPQIAGHGMSIVDNQVTLSGDVEDLKKIREKNYLIIETGDNSGVYKIYGVKLNLAGSALLYLNETLIAENAQENNRWVITNNLTINAFNPIKRLLPFGRVGLTVNTIVDQYEIATSVNVAEFGVEVDDILEIETGGSADTYTIKRVNPASVVVNKVTPESTVGNHATIFRVQRGLSRPLTKITSLELQGENAIVPYGAPIGMSSTYLGGAKTHREGMIGYVMPNLSNIFPRHPMNQEFLDFTIDLDDTINGAEKPYSKGAVRRPFGGVVHTAEIRFQDGDIEYDQEFLLPREIFEDPHKRNVFVAVGNIQYADMEPWINKFFGYTTDLGVEVPPSEDFLNTWRHEDGQYPLNAINIVDPVPSKPGDILTIHAGPNKGSYVIRDVHQVRLNFGDFNTWHRRLPISIVVIEGEFPESPLDPLFSLLGELPTIVPNRHAYRMDTVLKLLLSPIQLTNYDDFENAYNTTLDAIQTRMGINVGHFNNGRITPSQIKDLVESFMYVPYSAGEAAKGLARIYFQEPVTTEINTYAALLPVSKEDADPPVAELSTFYGRSSGGITVIPEVGELEHHIIADLDFDANNPLTWRRDLTVAELPVDAEMGMVYLPEHPFNFGLVPTGREVLKVFQEKILIPGVRPLVVGGAPTIYDEDKFRGLAVATYKAGTNKLTIMSPCPLLESQWQLALEDVGSYLFIDHGPDAGGYVITEVLPAERAVKINKLLTSTTAKILTRGVARIDATSPNQVKLVIDNQQDDGNTDRNLSSGFFSAADVGRMITLWNLVYETQDHRIHRTHVGSYKIISVTPVQDFPRSYVSLLFEGAVDWAAITGNDDIADPGSPEFPIYWTISAAPNRDPVALDHGRTELVGSVPIQIYEREADEYLISDINYTDLSDLQVVVKTMENEDPGETSIFDRIDTNMPYSIVRRGFLRITATEMAEQVDGNLFYVDIPIQSLGHSSQCNLPSNTMLTPHSYNCEGYKVVTRYPELTYSSREDSDILLPLSIIPEGFLDFEEERVSLIGKSVVASYEYSPEVAQLQSLLDQPADRITCASMLARRMLPATVGVYLQYTGGSTEKVLMEDLRKWIASLSVSYKPLEVSDFISLAYNRGAKHVVSPIQLYAVVHDLSREVHLIMVTDALRMSDLVDYDGTPRITGLSPGVVDSTTRKVAIKAIKLANISALGSGG